MKNKKPKIEDYMRSNTGFTLIRCARCGEFFDKHGKRHVCGESNSMELSTKLIADDKDEEGA